jgi:polysaccharide transporter, PST family
VSLGEKAETEPATLELAAKARRGTHAILATRVLSVFVSLASITILSRLIAPADFGVWAVATLALGMMTILRELGLVSSIVQAPDLTLEQQDSYFWASVAVSLATAALLALAAPLLANFYDSPLLRPVVWAGCVSLAIGGFGMVHAALLRRALQYNKVAVIEGGGILCGLAASLTGAYLWRDVWALVAGHIASAVWMSATAFIVCRWVPGAPRRRPAKINLSFSFQVTLYNLLTYTGNNVGVLAGYRFSAADLGFFNRAQQLYNLAHYAFLTPITEVAFSLLCRLKGDAYRDAYISLARRVSVLFIPYAAVLPIVSGDLVLALLGQTWAPATPLLAWFAPAIFGQAFASLFAQLMASQGRGEELRLWAVVDFALRGGGAMVGSRFGLVGLAAGFSLATFFLTVPLMLWIAGRSGPVRLRHQLLAMWPGVVLGAAAALVAALAVLGADALGLSAGWARLLFVGGSATLTWALLCLALRPARDALLGKGFARE